jgi:hypothetical protein
MNGYVSARILDDLHLSNPQACAMDRMNKANIYLPRVVTLIYADWFLFVLMVACVVPPRPNWSF